MKPLRIALWNNLPSGGGKRALFEFASRLKKRGHYLESWCPPTAHRNYLPLGAMMTEHVVDYDQTPFQVRFPWERFGKGVRMAGKKFAAMDRHCRECAEMMNAGGFDVLLATNCWYFAVPPISRHVRIPKVLYHQEPQRWLYEARPTLPWMAPSAVDHRVWPPKKLRRLITDYGSVVSNRIAVREELESVRAFDVVLANSSFSRESMIRSYGIEPRLCYLGVDSEMFKPTGVKRENYVVGLGAFQWHKGIDTAIQSIGAVAAEIRPKLVWIGNMAEASYVGEMTQLAKKLAVEFEPRQLINDDALVDTLNRAAAMIYTSRLEPFGFAPLEANACGTPVVAIAEGGVRETVQDGINGLLVADREVKALGAAVERLLRDGELARKLGEAGRRLVSEKWTWDASTNHLEEILREVQAGRN